MRAVVSAVAVLFLAPDMVAQVEPLIERGENDFRISFQQGTGDPSFDAESPAVAYNPVANEYMVVWQGQFQLPFPTCPNNSPTEQEIYRLRIDASTGEFLGSPGIISRSGPTCDNAHIATDPAIAYNAFENEYLVVWSGSDDRGQMVPGEFEIFGQLLDAVGTPVGVDDFRISVVGSVGTPSDDALAPAVVWNAVTNEYLVVWSGDDEPSEGREVYGERLNENGTRQGPDDFQISAMGGVANSLYSVESAGLTWNATENEYLVVWEADDNTGGLAPNEKEIFGQLLDAGGNETGLDDFRLSDMGDIGDNRYTARDPAVTWSSAGNDYFVIWWGDDNVGGLEDQEWEIFGQELNGLGLQVGDNDLRISDMGGTANTLYRAAHPATVWNAAAEEYLVIWNGSDDEDGQLASEYEIFGQRLDPDGSEIGDNDFRISDMGGIGNTTFGDYSSLPDVAWNSLSNEYLVVWYSDDNVGGLVDDELEIFGQRLAHPIIFADGFESGDTSAWSSSIP